MWYEEFDNALDINQYMTNAQLSYSVQHLDMEVLWLRMHHTDSRWRQKPPVQHRHSFCETHLCTRGTLMIRVEGNREYQIKEGEIVLIRENVEHQFIPPQNEWQRISFGYRLQKDNKTFNRPEGQVQPDVVVIPDGEFVYELYRQISGELRKKLPGYQEMIRILLFRAAMFHETHLSRLPKEETSTLSVSSKGNDVLSYIQQHLGESLTVVDVANAMHLSDRQVNRIANRDFTMPCSALIRSLRHKRAQELLALTDQTINEIAEQLGYGSMFSFSKFFKTMEGISPQNYRRAHQSY